MMKLSEKLEKALNDQVRFEYEAAAVYNGMRIYLEDLGAPGATNWMTKQVHEEFEHAQDFIDFIQEVDGEVKGIGSIPEVPCEYDGLLGVWEAGLEHEKEISASIRNILEIAIEEKHYAAENFLRTYIDEQVEEEDNFRSVIEMIKLAIDEEGIMDKGAMFKVDSILGER